MGLEPAVVIESQNSAKAVIFQFVGAELRYLLRGVGDGDLEIGVLSGVSNALTLCDEFLVQGRELNELGTARVRRSQRRI
jgi:hypothetical protein